MRFELFIKLFVTLSGVEVLFQYFPIHIFSKEEEILDQVRNDNNNDDYTQKFEKFLKFLNAVEVSEVSVFYLNYCLKQVIQKLINALTN